MESFGLNYSIPMPQYRQFPPINSASTQMNNSIHQFTPKSQRNSVRHLPKRNNFDAPSQVPDLVQYESVEEAFRNVNAATEWTAFDQERVEFWKSNSTQGGSVSAPKQQRNAKQSMDNRSATVTKNELHSNLFSLLKESSENATESNKLPMEEEPKGTLLHKHRKNCKNENDSFAQIRSIYPTVSLDILWDLFEKCEGDGDWTMDILLKDETRVDEYHNMDGNVCGTQNDFECDCDGSNSKTINTDPTNVPSASINDEVSYASTHQRPRRDRVAISTEEQLAAKRMIEESFQIGDEHYSNHTRKIRNLRRGHAMSPAGTVDSATNTETNTEESACAVDVVETDSNEKDDELLEINLGMDLVCQLDSVFGVEAYQRDALENLKANVFMPKSLAQQLYALWMESMFNQQEEQRQKSIKEDAEFARQLQSQQNYPGLHKHAKPPSDLKDIMEMEYALAAYRTEMDEWKSKTPQDLALQMTHDKLCSIFPDIDRETLVEVLAAHNNKFSETVDVLKDTLSGKAADKIAIEGRQLLEEVQTEVEMTTHKSKRPTSLENRKLGPDEAKRYALKEFEDTRNLAMRHTQLKAECYNKAKEAIQRGNTSVALYYSQVANLHKTKIDAYNHKAANCIMEVHNLTQKNPDMLDLHYLHVNEAAECLDIFLDKHINKLKSQPQTYKYIFVITGRGLHSANGISTIKQKVKNRFRERNLTWSEVNPGLLKVKIFVNSRLTITL
ncbi:hypothetical protein HA402_013581 [Bradysia odoriphaga]|nr:hypothetical protein HA402_013581 [Bradysia odoriphaga]